MRHNHNKTHRNKTSQIKNPYMPKMAIAPIERQKSRRNMLAYNMNKRFLGGKRCRWECQYELDWKTILRVPRIQRTNKKITPRWCLANGRKKNSSPRNRSNEIETHSVPCAWVNIRREQNLLHNNDVDRQQWKIRLTYIEVTKTNATRAKTKIK